MTEHKNARLGYLIPVLLFVLFFVLCCGVLTGVFLRAAALRQQTEAYNAAVQLCRNQAELYRAEAAGQGSYWYDEDFHPGTEATAAYRLEVTEQRRAEASGELRTGTIRAYDRQGKLLYELEAAVFLPEEEAKHGE